MRNETTNVSSADAIDSLASAGFRNSALEHASAAFAPAPLPPRRKRAGDEALMAFCDGYFAKLMEAARVAVVSPPKPGNNHSPDAIAREDYLQAQCHGKMVHGASVGRRPSFSASPERGLGPRVFIGFDAEWQYARKGRNRLLSVQFYVVGPTGETLPKVIHVSGGESIDERPTLGQAVYDLLEDAFDQDIIDEWPAEVVLCGFFTRADITVFADFRHLRKQLDGVGGSLVTVGKAASLDLPIKARREQELKARYQALVGDAFDPKILSIRLVDASRLAPPGKSLASLGDWLGIPKLDLPEGYGKDGMARFQLRERDKFEAYGLRDAEIAVMYVLWVVWFSSRYLELDMSHLSATASGIAVRVAEDCIRRDGVSLDVALNYEVKQIARWDNTRNVPRTLKKRIPKRIRRWLEPFLADAYIGGRNECFVYGPTDRKRFYDPDLSGAYLSALAYLFVLDYDRAFMTKDVEELIGHIAGFALVKFRFPPGTERPCLPVAVDGRGLLFPLSGESLCTAPEIELAKEMGAELDVQFGIVIPWMDRDDVFERSAAESGKHRKSRAALSGASTPTDKDRAVDKDSLSSTMQFPPPHHDDVGYRLFESFALYMRETRSHYIRKSLPFEFVKNISCSLYGKTGQGFKKKRAFGPREMDSVIVGPSRVSEAAVAALVCGFVRAVIGEILWKLPGGATAVSATTDGFLVDVPLEKLDLSGTMCRRFQALVDRVSPGSHMLENKHQVLQLFAGRTRLQVTSEADGALPIVTAKGGVKPGPDVKDENAFMMELILNRQPGQKLSYESFMSMRDQLPLGYDLQMERRETRVNAEYDFKRKPVPSSVRMIDIAGRGVAHVAFDTEPWRTVDEAADTRLLFDHWREIRCLKTVEDFQDWESFRAFRMAGRKRAREKVTGGAVSPVNTRSATGRRNLTKDGYVGVAKRVFLAAYQKRIWGLEGADMSQRELAAWLTERGYSTSLSAVKNGTGDLPDQYVVPAAPEVMDFLKAVKERFPGLETGRFLIVE